MHIVTPYAKIVRFMGTDGLDAVRFVEQVGRATHRTEGLATEESYRPFLEKYVLGAYHTSMMRFSYVVVKVVTDRGVAQEWTRHQTQDFQMESQRYCNYANGRFGKSVGFVKPSGLERLQEIWWEESMANAEDQYFEGLRIGLKPELAADVLPRATATLLMAGASFQAWRHFLLARTSVQCHPKMLNVTTDVPRFANETVDSVLLRQSLLDQFKTTFPVLFDDIKPWGQFVENMKKAR